MSWPFKPKRSGKTLRDENPETLQKKKLLPRLELQPQLIMEEQFVKQGVHNQGQRPAHLKTMRKRRRKFWVRMTMSKKIQRITSKVDTIP